MQLGMLAHLLVIATPNTDTDIATEMQNGGTPLFFDLFVAMVNHLVR